jgi:transposase-like protein
LFSDLLNKADWIMAAPRRVVELAFAREDVAELTRLARSRTEPVSRAERARMLLAYRETPSFYAVGRALGVTHQTVERCLRRAEKLGIMEALDDSPRPGRERIITEEARTFVVDLACRKPKDLGYPHELWTTRLLTRHIREHGPAVGHKCLANLAQGTLCKILAAYEIKPHKVRYYLERRDPLFDEKMAEVLCVYREVEVLKQSAIAQEQETPAVAIISYDEKPGVQAIGTTAPDLPRFCRKLFLAETWGYDRWKRVWRNSTMIEFKGSHFEREVILWGVRWYVAYPISYRQIEEMMEERGVEVDHSTLNRWVVKYAPLLDQQFRARKRPVGSSWRLDETYVKIKGSWKYLYRAVDKAGATVDFLLTAKRDRNAALRFLRKAIGHHGVPKKITIDKSGANTAAIESYNAEHEADIEIRRIKYLNNIVEQDHRAVKRVVRPMMGFKSFRSAAATLAGVELMHMIRKGQLRARGKLRPAQQFYALAG